MTKKRNILVLLALSIAVLFADAQDFERLSERTIMGTARYVGMGGAMTAIGGDPSSVKDNPAGLGLYRRSEVMFTIDCTVDNVEQAENGVPATPYKRGMLPQASWVISFCDYMRDRGVVSNNIMFSYNRLMTYNRTIRARGNNGAALGPLLEETGVDLGFPYCTDPYNVINSLDLSESGYVGEYSFDWGMNISHRWYTGLGLRLQSFSFSSTGDYYEQFERKNADGHPFDIENETSLLLSGVNCNLAIGLIYRPVQWARIGFSLQTPSVGSIVTGSSGTISALTDSVRYSKAPDLAESSKNFHSPLRLSTGLAFQLKNRGLLSLQYDYLHPQKDAYAKDVHSLRAGIEVIPVERLYINAGYAYESTFSRNDAPFHIDPTLDRQDTYYQHLQSAQYASVGLGYRGHYFIVQAAYQYRWQKFDVYAHEQVTEPYHFSADTHRIVLTLAWHREWP